MWLLRCSQTDICHDFQPTTAPVANSYRHFKPFYHSQVMMVAFSSYRLYLQLCKGLTEFSTGEMVLQTLLNSSAAWNVQVLEIPVGTRQKEITKIRHLFDSCKHRCMESMILSLVSRIHAHITSLRVSDCCILSSQFLSHNYALLTGGVQWC